MAPRCCLSLSVRGLTSHENSNRRESSRLNLRQQQQTSSKMWTPPKHLLNLVHHTPNGCRVLDVVSLKEPLSWCLVSFSVVSTVCSEIGRCARNRKHISAWTRRCPSLADEPQSLRGAEHFCPNYHCNAQAPNVTRPRCF